MKTLVWLKIVCFAYFEIKSDNFDEVFLWMGKKANLFSNLPSLGLKFPGYHRGILKLRFDRNKTYHKKVRPVLAYPSSLSNFAISVWLAPSLIFVEKTVEYNITALSKLREPQRKTIKTT